MNLGNKFTQSVRLPEAGSMKLKTVIFGIAAILMMAASAGAEADAHHEIRRQALTAYTNGNWKDAFDLFRKLSLEVQNDPKQVGKDFTHAWQCLRQLNRLNELDAFRENVIERHADNWRLMQNVARSYGQNNHWGYMVAGKFQRGHHRGGGKYVNAIARDRVRALQLMQQSMAAAEKDPAKPAVAQFYMAFARLIQQHRGDNQAWRLQYLTDLSRLPDYEPGYGHAYDRQAPGAPVDDRGRPVYHKLPKSFESAASDGERWRWLMARAAQLDSGLDNYVNYTWASFLHQQFGVQTLVDYSALYGRGLSSGQEDKDQSGP